MSLQLRYQGETQNAVGGCYWTVALMQDPEDGTWWMGLHGVHGDTGDVHDSPPVKLDKQGVDVDAAWDEAREHFKRLARAMLGMAPKVC